MQIEFIGNVNYISFIFLSLIFLAISLYIIKTKNLISITASLGFSSVIMTLYYLLLDAPDVALTEAAVGSCASTVILFYTIIKLKNWPTYKDKINWGVALICFILFCLLIIIGLDIPDFGSVDNITNHYVVPYYIKESGQDIGIRSVVASILASYRGFDTFGETLVIALGGISVGFILSKAKTE